MCAHLCDEKGWIWAAFIIVLRKKTRVFSNQMPDQSGQPSSNSLFFVCVMAVVPYVDSDLI